MAKLVVKPDKATFAALDKLLSEVPNGIKKACVNAENRTAKTGKVKVAAILAARVDAKKSHIAKNVYVGKATMRHPGASIKAMSRGVNLIAFKARQNKTGVSAILETRKSFPHAFINEGIGGAKLVFKRQGIKAVMTRGKHKGKIREIIKGIVGMSAQQLMLHIPGAMAGVSEGLKPVLEQNMKSQASWLIQRFNESKAEAQNE